MWKGIALALILTGCATTYKELKPESIKANQGVAIARVHVIYNNSSFTKNCGVCINSINGPCQKLDADGIIFIPIERGESRIRRLVCQDTSPQHYNIDGATFITKDGANYIGDITFRWTNKGGFKATSMFGAIGAIIDESSNDGHLEMSVSPSAQSRDSLIAIYKRQLALSHADVNWSPVKVGR